MLKPNRFGRYIKNEIINVGYEILDDGLTATDIKRDFGIALTHEQRLQYAIGFVCKKEWRGCVPVFDIAEILLKDARGEL